MGTSLNNGTNVNLNGLRLGNHFNDTRWLFGSIKRFTIWSEVLNQDQIQLNMASDQLYSGDLAADWRFGLENGDILYDHSGNGKHGIVIGPSWEEVIPGCTDPYAENYNENANSDDGSCFGYPDLAENAISFDGTDDYIDLGRPSDLNFTPQSNAFSLACWIKTESYGTIYSFGASNDVNQTQVKLVVRQDNGGIEVNIGGEVSYGSIPVNDGNWHHIALTVPNSTSGVKMFIDGIQQTFASGNGSIGNVTSSESGNIGARTNGTGYFYNGKIDGLSIWSYELDINEISSHMLGDSDDSDPGLVGYWKMNAGEGDILYDHSGNANHGTINGGAEWSNDEPVIVTFQYDAYDQIVSSNGIHIAGTFNNWSTSLSEMIDVDGDSVYTFSAAFSAGDVVEYKFINGNTWNDTHDIFTGDENCVIANENDFNRVITVLEEDMILDPVCISSCDPCDHPDIDVSPEFLSSDLYVGESETHTMSIINEGVINLNWTSYVSFSDDQNTVESTPEFGTGLIGDNRKINDEIVPNFDTYTSDPIRISSNESDLASRNGNNTPIDQILSNFNENYGSVNGVIPSIYYFIDGIKW